MHLQIHFTRCVPLYLEIVSGSKKLQVALKGNKRLQNMTRGSKKYQRVLRCPRGGKRYWEVITSSKRCQEVAKDGKRWLVVVWRRTTFVANGFTAFSRHLWPWAVTIKHKILIQSSQRPIWCNCSRQHCHMQNITSHHSFSQIWLIRFLGLYHKITFITR